MPAATGCRTSSSASRTSTAATTTTCTGWCACCRSSRTGCGAASRSRFTAARRRPRLHLRRRLRRRDRGGVEALVTGRVVNETVNLAYGQGNTLVHAANLIAAELGVEPQATIAPSLLGEVTHYVAHLEKARTLLGYEPQVPLEEGIALMVAWFLERRAAHPEEEELELADTDSSRLGTKTYAA